MQGWVKSCVCSQEDHFWVGNWNIDQDPQKYPIQIADEYILTLGTYLLLILMGMSHMNAGEYCPLFLVPELWAEIPWEKWPFVFCRLQFITYSAWWLLFTLQSCNVISSLCKPLNGLSTLKKMCTWSGSDLCHFFTPVQLHWLQWCYPWFIVVLVGLHEFMYFIWLKYVRKM